MRRPARPSFICARRREGNRDKLADATEKTEHYKDQRTDHAQHDLRNMHIVTDLVELLFLA